MPDGTLYTKPPDLYIFDNSIENRVKIYAVYPEWATNRHDATIRMSPFAAREVFK